MLNIRMFQSTKNEIKTEYTRGLYNRIWGLCWGTALGDAVGLPYESRDAVSDIDIKFPYTNPTRGWPLNDWSDDTDQMVLVMRSATIYDYAQNLQTWIEDGFPELGDQSGLGYDSLTSRVCSQEYFLDDPHAAAKDCWIELGSDRPHNGAIMKIAVCGVWKNWQRQAHDVCVTTHSDTKCIESCLVIAFITHNLIYNPSKTAADILTVLEKKKLSYECIKFMNTARDDKLATIGIDESGSWDHTFKCMACGIWMLCHGVDLDFRTAITRIIELGGDADTNAALAGAIWGARNGYSALPEEWIKATPNNNWLDREIQHFILNGKF